MPPTPPKDNDGTDEDDERGDGGLEGGNQLASLGLWLSAGADKYNALLEKHPMTTKIVTSGVIGGLGDIVSQKISDKEGAIDIRRLVMFTVAAAFYFAPVIGAWFSLLNSLPVPGSAATKAVVMIAVDQTIGAVSVIGTYFFFYELIDHLIPGGSACEEGKNPIVSIISKGSRTVSSTLPGVLVANWKLWPFVNFLNFRFIPPITNYWYQT